MANRGETKTQKSLSAPKTRSFLRKKNVFTQRTKPGAHSKNTAVPLGFVLRELIEVVNNAREAKRIVSDGKVKVNGKVRRDVSFSVGLFDIVELVDAGKKFRALMDTKGRIFMKETDSKEKDFKISKVVRKKKAEKGKTIITTNDGFNIEVNDEKVKVDDSVKISLPDAKVEQVFSLSEGNSVFIIGGSHVGEQAKIDGITGGTLHRKKSVSLSSGDRKYQTVMRNVIVIGKEKSAVEVLE